MSVGRDQKSIDTDGTEDRAPAADAGGLDLAADGDADTQFVAARADLLRLAWGITKSRDDAEDVVQEVWLRWRSHRGSITSASPWLRMVTRNAALDRLRNRKAAPRAATDLALLPELSVGPATPAVEIEVDVSRALDVVLRSLSTLERTVFVLHSGLDWSYADIAPLLNRSESAVRQIQHRAKQHVTAGVGRFEVEPKTAAAITSAYVGVARGQDVFALLDLLGPGLASPAPVFSRGQYQVVHDVAGIVLFQEDRLLLCHRRDRLPWYPSVSGFPGWPSASRRAGDRLCGPCGEAETRHLGGQSARDG